VQCEAVIVKANGAHYKKNFKGGTICLPALTLIAALNFRVKTIFFQERFDFGFINCLTAGSSFWRN
jgi:hypothetical protein